MSEKPPEFNGGNGSFRKALNAVVAYARRHGVNPRGLPGWSQTPDGWMPPPVFSSTSFQSPWDLTIEDAETGQVSVNLGTIIKDADDLTEAFVIVGGGATLAPSASNKWIYLKCENLASPSVTLVCGGDWTGHPSAVEVSGTGPSAEYAAYCYPLFHFRSTAATGYTAINESLFYRKVGASSHFILTHHNRQSDSDRPITSHLLMPYHEALP